MIPQCRNSSRQTSCPRPSTISSLQRSFLPRARNWQMLYMKQWTAARKKVSEKRSCPNLWTPTVRYWSWMIWKPRLHLVRNWHRSTWNSVWRIRITTSAASIMQVRSSSETTHRSRWATISPARTTHFRHPEPRDSSRRLIPVTSLRRSRSFAITKSLSASATRMWRHLRTLRAWSVTPAPSA